MIHNVIFNFFETIFTAQVRVNADISEGRLLGLGVNAHDTIVEICPLGDETHHGGKIPLRIVLASGRSIVYKPRSMMPEKLICDSDEGVLRHEGFGTYHVVCRTDASGDYGYSDFVQNIQDENTVSTREEVEQYVRKMCLLEEVSSRLGLSDLHYMNIITDHQNPCIIDAEVFLNPPGTESGLMNEENGALHTFDLMRGTDPKFVGKNKIWFHSSLTLGKQSDFRFGMSKSDLAEIKIDVEEIKATAQLSKETEEAILQARRRLQELNGRFALADTQDFTGAQGHLDHRNLGTVNKFIEAIRGWVNGGQRFTFNEDSVALIRKVAERDIRNHDVPAFHYDSKRDVILYHTVVIGVQKGSSYI